MGREIFNTLKIDNAIRWAIDCMNLIDNPLFLKHQTKDIDIDSHRGRIPNGMIKCTMVQAINDRKTRNNKVPGRINSDPFFQDIQSDDNGRSQQSDISYQLEGNIIFTDIESGKIRMAYLSLPIDTNGYIMIPDNTKVVKAVESYIKYNQLEILSDIGKVGDNKVAKEEQNYLWYVGAAQSERFLSNLDKAEGVANIASQLYPERLQHGRGYKDLGKKEFRKLW